MRLSSKCLEVTSATISQDRSSYLVQRDVNGRATRTANPLLCDLHTITEQSEGTHTHARTNERTKDHDAPKTGRTGPSGVRAERRNPEELGSDSWGARRILDLSPRAVGMSMSGSRRGPLGRTPAPWRSPHPSGDHLETMPIRVGYAFLPASITFLLLSRFTWALAKFSHPKQQPDFIGDVFR